ncbi:MAG: right-handed parallel beta-helix repeat-containing protein [Kordiimonadaceae bacterium]|nr:right-handed parallel beta-helix repeat-containing protein [Kordiimonadaceae bacterium]
MRNFFRHFFVLSLLIGIGFGTSLRAAELKDGEILVNGHIVRSLQEAFDEVAPGGIIRIGPGVFRQAGILKKKNGVHISGTADTVFDGVAAGNKAAFVIASNDVTIEDIGCRNISVRDRNGACVRLEGTNLTLKNVTFTDSENGLLSGRNSGKILIEDSVFERNGRAGRSHSVYVGSGELTILRSKFLSSKDQGHEIKSRASRLVIKNCIIASLEGDDSRLIDISDGGIAIIQNNLLVEGANTVNWQLFSFGVERSKYSTNMLRLEKNVIVTDREGGSEMVLVGKGMPAPIVRNNIIVGKFIKHDWSDENIIYKNRAELKWPEAPALPDWDPRKK